MLESGQLTKGGGEITRHADIVAPTPDKTPM